MTLPPAHRSPRHHDNQVYAAPYTFSPYGINGGYYYGRVTLNF